MSDRSPHVMPPAARAPVARWIAIFVGTVALTTLATADDKAAAGWEMLSRLNPREAAELFSVAAPQDELTAVGAAATLLAKQPRTQANARDALAQLQAIIARAPAGESAEITARYLVARIYEWHLQPADPAAAAAMYESLVAQNSAHPLAAHAAVHLARLRLYDEQQGAITERLAAAAALLAQTELPSARRDLHLLIGRSAHFFNQPLAGVIAHYEAALAEGIDDRISRSEVLLAIANYAYDLGEMERARHHYAWYVRENPRGRFQQWAHDRLTLLTPPSP